MWPFEMTFVFKFHFHYVEMGSSRGTLFMMYFLRYCNFQECFCHSYKQWCIETLSIEMLLFVYDIP